METTFRFTHNDDYIVSENPTATINVLQFSSDIKAAKYLANKPEGTVKQVPGYNIFLQSRSAAAQKVIYGAVQLYIDHKIKGNEKRYERYKSLPPRSQHLEGRAVDILLPETENVPQSEVIIHKDVREESFQTQEHHTVRKNDKRKH